MTDRPFIRKAVTAISEDNGGHLLSYYGAGPEPENVVDLMIKGAISEIDPALDVEVTLDGIESYLASLSDDDFETATCGEHSDVLALNIPEVANKFLNDAFEAPMPGDPVYP